MYVAFKVSEEKSVIWPCLYDKSITAKKAISHENKSLENPSGIKINKMYGIVEIESDGEMMMVVMNSTIYISLNEILLFAKAFTNEIVSRFLKECITKITKREIHDLSEIDCGFTHVDIMTEKMARRNWPVSMYSPESWRELQMAHGINGNWMIAIVTKQMKLDDDAVAAGTESEQPYDFLDELKSKDLDAELQKSIDEGKTNTFAALALKLNNSYIVDQYLMWLISSDIPEKHGKLATSLGARFMNGMQTQAAHRKSTGQMHQYTRAFSDISKHVETLRNLNNAGMITEFMVYACTMLAMPIYVLLLRETDIISLIKKHMGERPLFTDMVGIAFSYAMYYATRYEYDTTRFDATLEDPYVWTLDMVAAFPLFECAPGSHPFIQMGLKYFKLFAPWTIVDFNRHTVTSEEALVRMNITTIRTEKKLDFSQIMPWNELKLVFTGSRMGTCGAILPQEAEFENFNAYIENYVGTSEVEIDKGVAEFVNLKTNDIIVSIDVEANAIITGVFEACKKKSDIDIQFCGPLDAFDNTAKKLVLCLRKHGVVFMVKRKKFRDSYSWTIFADFLRYPIDLFCANRSSIRLITGFMTGYPRIYYNGNTFIVTSHYVVARTTGINIWYERMMLNDPIGMMMKAVVQEQTTLLINFRETQMLEKWMEKNEMKEEIVFGNVSTKNSIFWKGKKNAPEPLNSERHWLQTKWTTPLSNVEMSIWNNTELVIATNGIFDRYWNDLIEIQSKRTK